MGLGWTQQGEGSGAQASGPVAEGVQGTSYPPSQYNMQHSAGSGEPGSWDLQGQQMRFSPSGLAATSQAGRGTGAGREAGEGSSPGWHPVHQGASRGGGVGGQQWTAGPRSIRLMQGAEPGGGAIAERGAVAEGRAAVGGRRVCGAEAVAEGQGAVGSFDANLIPTGSGINTGQVGDFLCLNSTACVIVTV